jgi:PAS domain S-box-containing protein
VRTNADKGTSPFVLIIVFVAVAAVIVGAAGWFYERERNEVKEFRYLDLQALSRLIADRIQQWRGEAETLAGALAAACADADLTGSSTPASAQRESLRNRFVRVVELQGHAAAHLVDASGRVLIHADKGTCPFRSDTSELAQRAMREGKPVWSNLRSYGSRLYYVELAAPIRGSAGRSTGAVVLALDLSDAVFSMLAGWQSPTRTLEALLVMPTDGCMVELRPGRRPTPSTPPVPAALDLTDVTVVEALEGRVGHLRGLVRNREVYGYITYVYGTDWRLIVREEADEAMASARAFSDFWLWVVLASVAAAFAVLFAIWRNQQMAHYRELYQAELERGRTERELFASRAMLQLILDTIPQRVFWKDRELRYLGCNRPFALDAGLESPDQLLGKDDFVMSWEANAEQYRADDRAVIASGEPRVGYIEPQNRRDGTFRWLRTSKAPLRDDSGNVIGVLGTYEDITELVLVQDDLRATAADLEAVNKELSGVLSAVSHDLRSPLVNITGFGSELQVNLTELQELLEGVELPEAAAERVRAILNEEAPHALRTVVGAATLMNRLLSGVLTVSRAERAELTEETVKMGVLVEQVLNALSYELEQAGATVNVAPLPNCEGDAVLLARVFENLINNAVKYRDLSRPLQIRISAQVKQGNAIYCVEDNGVGIAANELERVFELFHRVGRNAAPGDGVGLTTVRAIVTRHGGRVWVESDPGIGSRFYVRLPRRSGARGRQQQPSAPVVEANDAPGQAQRPDGPAAR